ncbi:hypothetical protein CBR_g40929 [Chara braunii]|uniref:Integrase catalytic domain-containing protein n=1 Tax=Chara braunii TaxID=69332 RepID=A0A388LUN4_CHABU|nr:hypothetical protein CBR_g40929 [Chara braunii]|eukprot:GBG86028.1 hypothetical protein CBR_g40929 [Chara braunii]
MDNKIATLQAEISTLQAANSQQQTINDQLQSDVSTRLARPSAVASTGSVVADCNPALAAQAKQLEERINHVVTSLGDISKFAGASTVSNQLQTLSDHVQQRAAVVAKEWKMPNFKIEKFDNYHKTDPLQWWMAFNAKADVHHTPPLWRLDALYLQLIGGAQAFMTHMAVTLECTIATFHTKITWEEFEKKWKTRFMVNNDKRHALNKIFRMFQGQQPSWEWMTEWQRLVAVPPPSTDGGVAVVDLLVKIDREHAKQRYVDIDAPLLYIRIQIGKATCSALIDCGVSRNYISQDFMARVGLGPRVRRKSQPTHVTLADGHMQKSIDRCVDSVPVYFAPLACEAVSFDILDTKFDMILRMSWLQSEDHPVNFYRRTVHVRDRRGELALHGVPEDIVSDRDTRFMSAFWTTLMVESGTNMKPSSARHPQTYGQTERAHQTAQMMLRTLIRPDHKDWVDRLPDIEFAYNTSVHLAIGVTPFELHHGGRKGRIFTDIFLPWAADIDTACSPASTRKYRELLAKARANMQKAQARMLALITEAKRRADEVAAAKKKKAEDAEKARLLAIEQQRQQDEAAAKAADEERNQRSDKIFNGERALLTMAADWRAEAENAAGAMTRDASSSNTSDRLNALEIDVGTLKDDAQLQQTTTQQLEQRICAAAANPSSAPRETTPKFDGQKIFCDSTKTDPIPWFRKFELKLQLHHVIKDKHQAYLYSRSGGAYQAWLDNLLSKPRKSLSRTRRPRTSTVRLRQARAEISIDRKWSWSRRQRQPTLLARPCLPMQVTDSQPPGMVAAPTKAEDAARRRQTPHLSLGPAQQLQPHGPTTASRSKPTSNARDSTIVCGVTTISTTQWASRRKAKAGKLSTAGSESTTLSTSSEPVASRVTTLRSKAYEEVDSPFLLYSYEDYAARLIPMLGTHAQGQHVSAASSLSGSGNLSSSSGSSRDSAREFNIEVLDSLTSEDFAWLPLPIMGRLPGPQCAALCTHIHTYLSFYAPPTSPKEDEAAVGDILAYVTRVACEFRNQRYDDNNAPLLYVRIQVGQVSCSALLDGGVSRNFMSQAFMQRDGLGAQVRRKANPMTIKLADGRTQQLLDRYIEVVPVYCTPHACEPVAFDILNTDFDIILGMPWLASADHTVNFHRRTLTVRDAFGAEMPCTIPLPHPSIRCQVVMAKSFRATCAYEQPDEIGLCFLRTVAVANSSPTDLSSDPRVVRLLDEFADIFESPTGVVPDRSVSHEIILEAGVVPPKGCIYCMREEELPVLRAQLKDLLDRGWIRPSSSPYGAPVLFVRKKNKDRQLWIDYCKRQECGASSLYRRSS